MNRVGDFGFLLALFLMFRQFGTLDFAPVFTGAGAMPVESAGSGVLTAIALLLLAGATGKSAQLPLYVWLPDAMEGPTPVSALIHAATMVAAGVYMVARSNAIFTHAPLAMSAVAWTGCLTALFAATIALVQTDIKKVLAYSTISQLGYMFLGCGVGAFGAGIFHLMTHAFFKALLFLGAGSVIHACSGEQDMRHMGGLRKSIPWTYATMLIAALAIAAAPGFSGFFSKDQILLATRGASPALYILGVLTAGLTSFYIFRLMFLTFHGTPRGEGHPHESPASMLVPLVILAALSLAGGWWAAPHLVGGTDYFARFLGPVFGATAAAAASENGANALLSALLGAPVIAGLAGFLAAWWMYIRKPELPARLAASNRAVYDLVRHGYFVDAFYATAIVRPLVWISSRVLWHGVDETLIDGAVNGIADRTSELGNEVRHLSTGNIRTYATWVVLGAVVLTTVLVWVIR